MHYSERAEIYNNASMTVAASNSEYYNITEIQILSVYLVCASLHCLKIDLLASVKMPVTSVRTRIELVD